MVDNRSPTPLVKASIPFLNLSFLHSSFKFYFYVCLLTPSFSSAPAGHSTVGSFAGRRRDHSPGGRGMSSLDIGFFSVVIPDAHSSFFFFYARRPFHRGSPRTVSFGRSAGFVPPRNPLPFPSNSHFYPPKCLHFTAGCCWHYLSSS